VNYLGAICARPGQPEPALEAWESIARAHPHLVGVAGRWGINPFSRQACWYEPARGAVRVVIEGVEVGALHWAEDGARQVDVWGTTGAVEALAVELATVLGASFVRAQDVESAR
jgi:hypothetical protein